MTGSSLAPQVLGASTSVGAGVYLLPRTSGSPLLTILSLMLLTSGVLVISSLIASRIIIKIKSRS